MQKLLMSATKMPEVIRQIARKIVDAGFPGGYALVGIHEEGVPLSEKIADEIGKMSGCRPPLAKLDISMYRDDIGKTKHLPRIRETDIPFDINDRTLILVDDVLSSGRTIRAALDAINDYGRPALIRLAVLIDRGNPEYPIRADYVGKKIELPPDHRITVRFEGEGDPGVFDELWLDKHPSVKE
ncbi:MAG: bifunctional pyr operon transcriptional regulator/uracil phosphoribosyltransferase PyrR [Victivallaceae bacterium]|nr:bifunctional pyr operon transcriptional regulator/uracil phosphoribosyltransferase PyrR [Victivallaceae bacterium]